MRQPLTRHAVDWERFFSSLLGSWDKGLLESDGLPTAAFLHVDAREHNLALGIFSRHRSCDIGLTGNHRSVAIHAHLHIGNLIRGELGSAGFEVVYHLRLVRHLA